MSRIEKFNIDDNTYEVGKIASTSNLGVVQIGSGLSVTQGGVLSANGTPLYSTTGQNTDGAMTQKATSDALDTKASVSANVSTFTNDAGYQTSSQVSSAIAAAIGDITELEYQVVQELPVTGEKGTIYLISNSGTTPNVYDEYIWVSSGSSGSYEKIGTTEVDLSNYVTSSDLSTTLASYATIASLATVATSGSYNDLSNKPSIPTWTYTTTDPGEGGTLAENNFIGVYE